MPVPDLVLKRQQLFHWPFWELRIFIMRSICTGVCCTSCLGPECDRWSTAPSPAYLPLVSARLRGCACQLRICRALVRLHYYGSGQRIYLATTTTDWDNFWSMWHPNGPADSFSPISSLSTRRKFWVSRQNISTQVTYLVGEKEVKEQKTKSFQFRIWNNWKSLN